MRRRPVWFLAIPMIVFLAVLTGWNRTAADDWPDQSVDFRLNQIMVKLGQIEWELSQVKNRLGSRDRRLTDIDRKLDRILEQIEEVASTASTASSASMESTEFAESAESSTSASSSGTAASASSASSSGAEASNASASSGTAIDPALVGTWRLARNDFAEHIPNNIRRFLAEQASQSDGMVRRSRIDRIDQNVTEIIVKFEEILNETGFRVMSFRPDGYYTDSTGDDGMWLVSGDRLILTTFDGRAYPCTYFIDGDELTLTITGDQIGTLFRLAPGKPPGLTGKMIDQVFLNEDRVRLFYKRDI